VATLTKD
jgi:hypothetical protein